MTLSTTRSLCVIVPAVGVTLYHVAFPNSPNSVGAYYFLKNSGLAGGGRPALYGIKGQPGSSVLKAHAPGIEKKTLKLSASIMTKIRRAMGFPSCCLPW